jgi:uncharacterized protein
VIRYLLTGLLAGALALSGDLHARCGADALPISDVQGGVEASPLSGRTVTVEGVITLDSRHPGGWRGFYLQQADSETDNRPQTSEALFIYTDRAGGIPGSRIRVTGRVKEYHGLTELTQVSELTLCGPAKLPEPVTVELPWPDQQPPEHLENMRITLRQPLTLIGHYSFARYGELILADQPQVTPTEILPPGPGAKAMANQQAMNRLYLDDGRSTRNPDPLPWPAPLLTGERPVRAGDRIAGLTGILDFRFGQWRLQPTLKPDHLQQNPRPEAPPRSPSTNLRVVTLNLGNFFNGDGSGKGFADSRGARNQSELDAQRSRLVATLTALEPDVIAAAEMENDDYGPASAIAELAAAMGPTWRFVATPGATGTDAIRNDLLYRADRVRTVAEPRRFNHGFFRYQGRPPIAQLFQPLAGDRQKIVRIVVPHLKSKACGGANGTDQDQGDGQGCYAKRRTDAASALADWLATLPEPEQAQGEFAGTLVTGDLNSYAREWPIQRLESAGLDNLVRRYHECGRNHCPQTSYQYRGRKGSLDHSLGSKSLLGQVVGAGVWPVNAAEFPVIGYQGDLAAPGGVPWRSSDHDPIYTDLAL